MQEMLLWSRNKQTEKKSQWREVTSRKSESQHNETKAKMAATKVNEEKEIDDQSGTHITSVIFNLPEEMSSFKLLLRWTPHPLNKKKSSPTVSSDA